MDNGAKFQQALRILAVIASPPNQRERPMAGDLPGTHYAFWFDGGAAERNTGGGTQYTFADGASAHQAYPYEGGYPNVLMKLSDGSEVELRFKRDA